MQALRDGRTGYPDNQGEPALRAGRRREARARPGPDLRPRPRDPDHRRGHAAASARPWRPWSSRATSVLLPDPIYDAYASPIALWGGRPVARPPRRSATAGSRFDRDALGASLDAAGRASLLLNTPWNPVGTVLTRDELAGRRWTSPQAHDLIGPQRRDLRVAGLRRPAARLAGRRLRPTPGSGRSLVNSLSKTYAMTGWRVGYCAGPGRVIAGDARWSCSSRAAGRPRSCRTPPPCALTSDQECVRRMAAEYQGRRDRVVERLRGIPGVEPLVPEGGLFVMVDVRGLGHAVGRGPPVPAARGGRRRDPRLGLRAGRRGHAARLVRGRRRDPRARAGPAPRRAAPAVGRGPREEPA